MSRSISFGKYREEYFIVSAPGPGNCGREAIHVSKDVFERYSAEAIAAKHYGVTEQQLLGWVSEGCGVRCQAKTKRGKRCLLYAPGLSAVTASDWVSIGQRYCSLHEDGR